MATHLASKLEKLGVADSEMLLLKGGSQEISITCWDASYLMLSQFIKRIFYTPVLSDIQG